MSLMMLMLMLAADADIWPTVRQLYDIDAIYYFHDAFRFRAALSCHFHSDVD